MAAWLDWWNEEERDRLLALVKVQNTDITTTLARLRAAPGNRDEVASCLHDLVSECLQGTFQSSPSSSSSSTTTKAAAAAAAAPQPIFFLYLFIFSLIFFLFLFFLSDEAAEAFAGGQAVELLGDLMGRHGTSPEIALCVCLTLLHVLTMRPSLAPVLNHNGAAAAVCNFHDDLPLPSPSKHAHKLAHSCLFKKKVVVSALRAQPGVVAVQCAGAAALEHLAGSALDASSVAALCAALAAHPASGSLSFRAARALQAMVAGRHDRVVSAALSSCRRAQSEFDPGTRAYAACQAVLDTADQ